MIYTIGHKKMYEKYFEEIPKLKKMGKTSDYEGGTVWKTLQEAKEYCPEDYEVYGVEADWEKDTEPSNIAEWRYLMVDAELVKL